MQVDILIIKKEKGYQVRKKIGHIFRGHNLFEYKSPNDMLSVNDFYKVIGYACFYQADTKRILEIDPEDITITFVCGHFPAKMIEHIDQRFNIIPKPYAPGIYHLAGGLFPIQLVITKYLSQEDYYWLQNLRTALKAGGEIRRLIEYYDPNKHSELYQSVVNVILRANWKEAEVEKEMCEALRELFAEDFKESEMRGLNQGLEQGLKQGRTQMKEAIKLRLSGVSDDEIAKRLDLPVTTVKQMLED